MDANMRSRSPHESDGKPSFRKPSNDGRSRKYRHHSLVNEPRSTMSGSPKHGRSSSPPSDDSRKRKDEGRESHKQSERHSHGRSRDYRRDNDYSGYHKHMDGEKDYKRSSMSGRESRSNTTDYSRRDGRSDRSRGYSRNSDKYSRDTPDEFHKDRERDSSALERYKHKEKYNPSDAAEADKTVERNRVGGGAVKKQKHREGESDRLKGRYDKEAEEDSSVKKMKANLDSDTSFAKAREPDPKFVSASNESLTSNSKAAQGSGDGTVAKPAQTSYNKAEFTDSLNAAAEMDVLSKLAKVETPHSNYGSGMVSGLAGIGFPPQSHSGAMQPTYNSAMAVPPLGWPLPWFQPQHPSLSPMGSTQVQQPLFPIQNVKPPLGSTTSSPAIPPPLHVTPPGLPSPARSQPVSQPLFPVIGNKIVTYIQSPPFSTPATSLGSSLEPRNSVDIYSSVNANSYCDPNIQGGPLMHSLSLASGPTTSGPSQPIVRKILSHEASYWNSDPGKGTIQSIQTVSGCHVSLGIIDDRWHMFFYGTNDQCSIAEKMWMITANKVMASYYKGKGYPLSKPPLGHPHGGQNNDAWEVGWDPITQKEYHYNTFTGESQWEKPAGSYG